MKRFRERLTKNANEFDQIVSDMLSRIETLKNTIASRPVFTKPVIGVDMVEVKYMGKIMTPEEFFATIEAKRK